VNDSATIAVVQNIVRRESRSLLQYIQEAYPWTRTDEQPVLTELAKLTAEEAKSTTGLATYLLRRLHAHLPHLGQYPQQFTSINYVGLDFLLPRLLQDQRHAIAELEKDLGKLTCTDARTQVEKVLEMKRRHLKKLEELAAPVAA
jgi:hypothetical protein